jgi:hypothetical protein
MARPRIPTPTVRLESETFVDVGQESALGGKYFLREGWNRPSCRRSNASEYRNERQGIRPNRLARARPSARLRRCRNTSHKISFQVSIAPGQKFRKVILSARERCRWAGRQPPGFVRPRKCADRTFNCCRVGRVFDQSGSACSEALQRVERLLRASPFRGGSRRISKPKVPPAA